MSTGLIEIMKRASLDAMGNAQICDLRYGKVVSTSPLKVQITNQFTIPNSLLVVPQHLTDYKVECTIKQPSQNISGTTEKSSELANESEPISQHTHTFDAKTDEKVSRSTVTIHNSLKIGDKVALLRKQGGQSYFILDRI